MAQEIIKFDYNGNQIPFEKGNDVMVNLTAMAKSYPDKNLSTIVNSQEIRDYCSSLSKLKKISLADLLIVRRGGDNPGTWAHRLVAIRVAQKLNSDLAVWVDMRIEELLTTGSTSLQPQLPNFHNPAEAARAWADQYEKNQTLALEVKKKEEEKQALIEETKPAVIFKECVTGSATNILVGEPAKFITQNGYKIGEIRLYDWLVENKYLIRKKRYSKSKDRYENDYMPTQRAAEMELFFVRERTILSGESPIFVKHTCYVTGKGQVYFLNKFKTLIAA